MAIYINPSICPQSHRCPMMTVCPQGAITQTGFGLPQIDKEKCIECGKCIRACRLGAVSREED